eukprot:7007182-Prymnesium_polylepis.3
MRLVATCADGAPLSGAATIADVLESISRAECALVNFDAVKGSPESTGDLVTESILSSVRAPSVEFGAESDSDATRFGGSSSSNRCQVWAARVPSECSLNPSYMNIYCSNSCNAVSGSPPLVPTVPLPSPPPRSSPSPPRWSAPSSPPAAPLLQQVPSSESASQSSTADEVQLHAESNCADAPDSEVAAAAPIREVDVATCAAVAKSHLCTVAGDLCPRSCGTCKPLHERKLQIFLIAHHPPPPPSPPYPPSPPEDANPDCLMWATWVP